MIIILMGLIVFAAILAVGYPLVSAQGWEFAGSGVEGDENFEHLASARNSVFEAIRDLEFDRATDKLSDADYHSMRARYDAQAAQVLQKMDALETAQVKRGAGIKVAGGKPAAKATSLESAAKKSYCGHCGAKVEAGDHFCPVCGTRLN